MPVEIPIKYSRPDLQALKVWIENGRHPEDQPPGYDISGLLTPKGRLVLAESIGRINRLEGNKSASDPRLQQDWYFEGWMIETLKRTT